MLKQYLFVVICALFISKTSASEWERIYETVSPSIPVILTEGRGICSGALVEKDKIITAAHCISNLRKIYISWIDDLSTEIQANVIALDFENDLAVLSVSSQENRKTISIVKDERDIKVGEEVATIGHPLAISVKKPEVLKDQTYVLSRGVVSKINEKNIMTDASVSPGNSGGPLLNKNGEIIGVLSKKNVAFGSGDNATLTTSAQVTKLIEYASSSQAKPIRWYHAQSTAYSVLSISSYSFLKDKNSESLEFFGIGLRLDFADRIPLAAHATFHEEKNSILKFYGGYKFSFYLEKFFPIGITPVIGLLSHRFDESDKTKKTDALMYGVLFDFFNISIESNFYRIFGKDESSISLMINFKWGP